MINDANLQDTFDEIENLAHEISEPVDVSKFQPITSSELLEILGLTIKKDSDNKLVTFLCELSAYTDNCQFNISFNALSSSGKSFIPLEISRLFPEEDVLKLGGCSPTAFFHEQGTFDAVTNTTTIDLSRKILIFTDQPNNMLLERLRSLFSHDEKEMISKITDKNQKGGNRTKTVILKGFPSVIFCSAGIRIDDQESTRFLLLSPEVNQEKIRLGILEKIRKEADSENYQELLNLEPNRLLLIERIRAIKQEHIDLIKIASPKLLIESFLKQGKMLMPRHQRDIGRLISLVKNFALLNLWWREKKGATIIANEEDIKEAIALWDRISISQELNIPPYIYNLYQEVILPIWLEKNQSKFGIRQVEGSVGVSRKDILQKHHGVYGRMLDPIQLRQQILPMLETAGLISQEQSERDKREFLVYPSAPSPTSNYSEMESGVTAKDDLIAEAERLFADYPSEFESDKE